MGKMSLPEKFMAGIFVIALILWVLGDTLNVDATLTAFIALSLLLLTGVLSWSDILQEKGAWNTLTWFSILVMMANELNVLGFIPWLSKTIASCVHGLSWPLVLIVLILFYFYSHYLFASATAHVSAMYSALLGVAVASGVPPLLAALFLGFFGNLFASTTHYSNGPAPILFSAGYVSQKDWWRLNAILGIVYLVVWLGLGSLWMKICGIY
ncbi:di- and tricarboxylate transporter [Liquorilactobacillus mali]|uniref:Di-and tricarboxylate transporter n=2 Tax=Liquorilactobacillus mali TaxID=1618 RepID=A0A0R2FYG3_9LACO|nr:di- and tricarboxylate transporter [Liquorilactobacillus mali]